MARHHEESFTFAEPVELPVVTTGDTYKVEFTRTRRTIECAPGTPVLAAAAQAGLSLPASCAQGMCGTCKTTLLAGSVDMRHNGGIRPREIAQNKILLCCSKPLGDLVLDADLYGRARPKRSSTNFESRRASSGVRCAPVKNVCMTSPSSIAVNSTAASAASRGANSPPSMPRRMTRSTTLRQSAYCSSCQAVSRVSCMAGGPVVQPELPVRQRLRVRGQVLVDEHRQALPGGGRAEAQFGDRLVEEVGLHLQHVNEDLVDAPEVVADGAAGHPAGGGDVPYTCCCQALLRQHLPCRLHHQLAAHLGGMA